MYHFIYISQHHGQAGRLLCILQVERKFEWVMFNAQSHRIRKSCKWSSVLASSPVTLLCNHLKAGVGHLFIPAIMLHCQCTYTEKLIPCNWDKWCLKSEAHSIIGRTYCYTRQHVLGTSQYTLSSEGTPSSVLATCIMEGSGQFLL